MCRVEPVQAGLSALHDPTRVRVVLALAWMITNCHLASNQRHVMPTISFRAIRPRTPRWSSSLPGGAYRARGTLGRGHPQLGSRVSILGLRGSIGKIRRHAMTLSKDIPPCEHHCHGVTRLNPGRQILDVDADDQPLEFLGHAVVLNEKCGSIFSWNVPLLKTRMLNRSTCRPASRVCRSAR